MSRPLVSVLTPTWQRHELVLEAIENVRQQTYRPLEHVIVSDGPDHELRRLSNDWITQRVTAARDDGLDYPPVRFADLGRNWSSVLPDSFCAAPLVTAQLLARGDYQMFLADDERMEPDHIASLVDLLEEKTTDFAYSMVSMWFAGRPDHVWTIGAYPPMCGQITNALYRADLLKRGLYPFGMGMTSDWACIAQWINAGAKHAFLPRVTLSHRVDH